MLCKNCKEEQRHHANGACLFAPTSFVAMTPEELTAFCEKMLFALFGGRTISQVIEEVPGIARKILPPTEK